MTDFSFIKKDERDLFNYHDEKIPYLSFKSLDKLNIVNNAVSMRYTREGEPVKLYFAKDSDIKEVTEHNRIFMREIGADIKARVAPMQKHTNNVHVVTKDDLGTSIEKSHIEFTDALVTDMRNVPLVVNVADCIPLMFVDPIQKVIAIAHSGRKGTLNCIGLETVRKMQEEFSSDPDDIIATIGPGICSDCYEVGDEIYDEFSEKWGSFVANRLMKRYNKKYHLDLLRANKLVLIDAGLKDENICVSNICNRCNCDKFYSFRGDGGIINEIAVCLMLK
jgi:YfiH family protein